MDRRIVNRKEAGESWVGGAGPPYSRRIFGKEAIKLLRPGGWADVGTGYIQEPVLGDPV